MSTAGPQDRLAELGINLPPLRPRAGNYIGWSRLGSLLFLAGQGADGWIGRVGDNYTLDDGRRAARDCMLNLLAQTVDAVRSLDHVRAIHKVTGFVACTEDFTDTPKVMDGASDLLIELYGPSGRHPRSAIGVQALPLGFAVEIEMILEVTESGAGRRAYRHAT